MTISSKTTIHDQFFIRLADGHQQTVQLQDWDFPVADDQVVSALWAIREGATTGAYLVMRNHTTGGSQVGSSFLLAHLIRLGSGKVVLLELIFSIGLAVLATPILGSFPGALAAAIGGVFVGSTFWTLVIKPRFLTRFRHDGLPQINTALDGLAAGATTS